MINLITDGISIAISEEFGEDYTIYTEPIEQDLKEPCFFIQCLKPSVELYRGRRYLNRNPYMIQYFPKGSDTYAECMEVFERLSDALEIIKMGDDLQRCTKMEGEIVDDILNVSTEYNYFTYKPVEEPLMETISFTPNAKE